MWLASYGLSGPVLGQDIPLSCTSKQTKKSNAMQLYLDNIFIVESATRFDLLVFTDCLQAQAKDVH